MSQINTIYLWTFEYNIVDLKPDIVADWSLVRIDDIFSGFMIWLTSAALTFASGTIGTLFPFHKSSNMFEYHPN